MLKWALDRHALHPRQAAGHLHREGVRAAAMARPDGGDDVVPLFVRHVRPKYVGGVLNWLVQVHEAVVVDVDGTVPAGAGTRRRLKPPLRPVVALATATSMRTGWRSAASTRGRRRACTASSMDGIRRNNADKPWLANLLARAHNSEYAFISRAGVLEVGLAAFTMNQKFFVQICVSLAHFI